MEPDNPLLDEFVLSLSGRKLPRVCFLPTASGDSAAYLVKFYRAFSGCARATDLTLFDPSSLPRRPARSADLTEFIAEQDIVYVGGGNTANLLAMWRAHGLDRILRDAWMSGKIMCGVSAGMLCWFQGGVTDSFGGAAALEDGLGFIDASACPHYDSESLRRPTYHRLIEEGFACGYAADDGAALHFQGTELVEVVTSRPTARAFRVEMTEGRVTETALASRFLGDSVPSTRESKAG